MASCRSAASGGGTGTSSYRSSSSYSAGTSQRSQDADAAARTPTSARSAGPAAAAATPLGSCRSEYSYYSSGLPSSYYTDDYSERTWRGGGGDPPLVARIASGAEALLSAVDGAFSWLTDDQPVRRVPAPPRPERRVEALPRGGARRRGGTLEWREVGELRAALSEDSESQQVLST